MTSNSMPPLIRVDVCAVSVGIGSQAAASSAYSQKANGQEPTLATCEGTDGPVKASMRWEMVLPFAILMLCNV